MRKSPQQVIGLRPKVALSGIELDERDPSWATTPSIADAERKLAVAVIAQAFSDLRLKVRNRIPEDKGRKTPREVHENKRIRNQAVLFLTSGPERPEWCESRCYWASKANYCPDKIRTRALAICRDNDIRIVPIGDDVDSIAVTPPSIPHHRDGRHTRAVQEALTCQAYTVNQLIELLEMPNRRIRDILDRLKRSNTVTKIAGAQPAKYRLSAQP